MPVRIRKQTHWVFDLTPMIDCVFQLLIFFLVVARFSDEERELELAPPSATEAQPLAQRPQDLVINIDESGRYTVNDAPVDLDRLRQILKRAGVNNPAHQSVVFRTDRRCRFEYFAAAVGACHEAKIRSYRFTTGDGGG